MSKKPWEMDWSSPSLKVWCMCRSFVGSHTKRCPGSFKEIAMDRQQQQQQQLFENIRAFDIDGGPSAFRFAERLAKENRWSRSFADRVIDEYRKFLFLAVAAGHPVSPSDAVDEAWHLHLLYTESY